MALPPRTTTGRFRRVRSTTTGFRASRPRLAPGLVPADAPEVDGVRRGEPIVLGATPEKTKTTKTSTTTTSSGS